MLNKPTEDYHKSIQNIKPLTFKA